MRLAQCRTGRDALFLCGSYKPEAMWWACAASRSRVPRAPKCCARRRPLSGPPALRPRGGITFSTPPSGRSLSPGLGARRTGSPASVRHGGAPASCQRVQSQVFPDPRSSSHLPWVCCLVGVPARIQGTGGAATHSPTSALSLFFLRPRRIFLTGRSSPYTSTSLSSLSGTSCVLLRV